MAMMSQLVFQRCRIFVTNCSYKSIFHDNNITGSGVMTMDWPEIRNIPCTFCLIYGAWGQLGMPKLAQMSLMKFYWMQQNARPRVFTISQLSRKNQQRMQIKLPYISQPLPTQIRVNDNSIYYPQGFSKNICKTFLKKKILYQIKE